MSDDRFFSPASLPVVLTYARELTFDDISAVDRWCTEMFGANSFYMSLVGTRVETEEVGVLLKLSFPDLFGAA